MDASLEPLILQIDDAITTADLPTLQRLLDPLPDPNAITIDEKSILLYALSKRVPFEMITYLLATPLDKEALSDQGVGVLDEAIAYGSLDLVKLLVETYRFDPSTTKRASGFTPLMAAASYNKLEIARYLLDHGADIAAVDTTGMSALGYATMLGQAKMKQFLQSQLEA